MQPVVLQHVRRSSCSRRNRRKAAASSSSSPPEENIPGPGCMQPTAFNNPELFPILLGFWFVGARGVLPRLSWQWLFRPEEANATLVFLRRLLFRRPSGA